MKKEAGEEKKLLTILGSPHSDGTTAKMLAFAEEEARRAGWKIDRVNLYEKQIAFCTGCRTCLRTQSCVQKDDAGQIAELLKDCDTVILAAPVYWANVPAAVKNLFDRLLGTAMEETKPFPKPRLSGKQTYLLFTACNTPFPFSGLCGQSSGAIRAVDEFFKTAGLKCGGRFTAAGTANQKELPKRFQRRMGKYWWGIAE